MAVHKDNKKGTWYAQFRYTDWQGQRKGKMKRGFPTKKAAKEYEEEYLRTSASSPDMTMQSLCGLYLADLKARRKTNTAYDEESIINNHILPPLGKMSLTKITVTTIREWQNQIMSKKGLTTKKPLSPHTIRNISVCLSSILNYAVRFYNLPKNPVQVARGIGKANARIDFWEMDEWKKFISVIEDEYDRLCFSFLFTSGLRLGEMLALTPNDVDFSSNKISVSKTFNWKLKYSGAPKTETSNRVITMPEYVMNMLKDFLLRCYEPPDRIFEATSQKRLTARMKKYSEMAGIKKIRIHDLRHSHASFLIHSGVPITAISQRLGHKSPKITLDVYSHVYKSSDAEIASILEKCDQSAIKS